MSDRHRRSNTQLVTVKVEKPDDANFVLGQTHFIKSVEDVHEALVAAVPELRHASDQGRVRA